jgi:hypothetical protein
MENVEATVERHSNGAISRMIELYLWMFLGFIFPTPLWIWIFSGFGDFKEGLYRNYYGVLLGLVTLIFPIVFRLIFEKFPLESLRESRKNKKANNVDRTPSVPTTVVDMDAAPVASTQPKINLLRLAARSYYDPWDQPEAYIHELAKSSESISQKIYTRAGVYLLFGVLIAFSGVLFFYFQSIHVVTTEKITALIVNLAPRLGVLIFIELIAFFFLRQYRIAMDEYRHFEAIKRQREDNLAILTLSTKDWDGKEIGPIIDKCGFHKNVGHLNNGESTESLETRKLSADEINLLEKMLEIGKEKIKP